jgi:hypothetical protein
VTVAVVKKKNDEDCCCCVVASGASFVGVKVDCFTSCVMKRRADVTAFVVQLFRDRLVKALLLYIIKIIIVSDCCRNNDVC